MYQWKRWIGPEGVHVENLYGTFNPSDIHQTPYPKEVSKLYSWYCCRSDYLYSRVVYKNLK